MTFCNLRIAWSAFWGIAALLLAILCARSYWYHDAAMNSRAEIHSVANRLVIHWHPSHPLHPRPLFFHTQPTNPKPQYATSVKSVGGPWGVGFTNDWGTRVYVSPLWFWVLITAVPAVLPWTGRQFSLRTLLTASTLIAALLGLAAYTAR